MGSYEKLRRGGTVDVGVLCCCWDPGNCRWSGERVGVLLSLAQNDAKVRWSCETAERNPEKPSGNQIELVGMSQLRYQRWPLPCWVKSSQRLIQQREVGVLQRKS